MLAKGMDDEKHNHGASKDIAPQDANVYHDVGSLKSSLTSMPNDGTRSPSAWAQLRPADGRSDLRSVQPRSNTSSPGKRQYCLDGEAGFENTVEVRPEKRIRLSVRPDSSLTGTAECDRGQETPQDEHSGSSVQRFDHFSRQDSEAPSREIGIRCPNCAGGDEILEALINNTIQLRRELASILRPSRFGENSFETTTSNVTQQGLKHSLYWINHEVQLTTRVMQDFSKIQKPGLPSLAEVVPNSDIGKTAISTIAVQSPLTATANQPWRLSATTDLTRSGDYQRQSEGNIKDNLYQPYEPSFPPVPPPEEIKRIQTYDTWPQVTAHSPHPSSGSSAFGSTLSPMQSQPPSRALPSPPVSHSTHTGTSVSMGYTSSASQAAHSSHLQDLQHQISTKTLALQTLQREHDQLLAAFSRSQIRCNTLDKKTKVSDHEINSLTEEKVQLEQQIVSLESQVEGLVKSRDEASKQLTADGAQWRQIMAMSSQLQLKGADEARQHKADRDQWNTERAALERRIRELESGQVSPTDTSSLIGITFSTADADVLNSSSVEALKKEIVCLRRRCAELKAMLEDIMGETDQIDEAIAGLANIRRRISSKKLRDTGKDEI